MTPIIDQLLPSSCPHPSKIGGLSILQNLTTRTNKNDIVYIHPLEKRSTLTEKGLEMCTENLGSESGNDVSSFDFPVPSPKKSVFSSRTLVVREEKTSLPPPLPSLSGVHMESVREGGRLVMRAVSVGPAHACFEAQRVNGRLILSFAQAQRDMDGNYEEVEANTYARASTSRCVKDESRNKDMYFPEAFRVATS